MNSTSQTIINAAMQHKITTDDADRALDIAMRVEKQITCPVTGKVMDSRTALGIFDEDDADRCLGVIHPDARSHENVVGLLNDKPQLVLRDAVDIWMRLS